MGSRDLHTTLRAGGLRRRHQRLRVHPRAVGLDRLGDPQWARPTASCSPTSPANHYYDAFAITNNTGLTQTVDITAKGSGDGYLHVYSHPLDVSTVDGCLSGDDDLTGAPDYLDSAILNESIAPGVTLHIIASTFSPNDATGPYTIDVVTD